MIETGRIVPPNVLMTSRIIWAAMIIGQLLFAGVIAFLNFNGILKAQRSPINLLIMIDAMMLIVGVIAGWLIGGSMKKPTADESIAIRRYQTASIVSMALLEGPSFFGLTIVLLSTKWWPGGVVPGICLCLQLIRFPRGDRR